MSQPRLHPSGVEPDEWWLPHIENWGVPDWREQSAYPKQISMTAWAWEFLRRNPEYRLTWLEVAAPRNRESPSPYRGDPRRDPRRFGLREFFDPRLSNAKPRFTTLRGETVLHFGPKSFSCSVNEAAIVVDLSCPLGPQLKQATVKLKVRARLQPRRSRLRATMFPKYLRILDAVEQLRRFDERGRERVSTSTIGRVFKPDSDSKTQSIYFQRWRAEAERLRDGGYWTIATRDK
jgi:transcriptional regulator